MFEVLGTHSFMYSIIPFLRYRNTLNVLIMQFIRYQNVT